MCMYVNVCMYVYMYVRNVCVLCVYVCMYVCMYVCVHVRMCVYVCMYVYMYVCMYVCMYVSITISNQDHIYTSIVTSVNEMKVHLHNSSLYHSKLSENLKLSKLNPHMSESTGTPLYR